MFRQMRRKKQALPRQVCDEVLFRGTSGVLALLGDGGYPYAVPLNYVYDGQKIYFHCAVDGHKIDAIRREPKASFCVIDQDQVMPAEYTSYFRSVIVFGTVRVLEDEQEKRASIEKLAIRYAPMDSKQNRDRVIALEWAPLCMLEMTIDHISGKQAIELVRQQEAGE